MPKRPQPPLDPNELQRMFDLVAGTLRAEIAARAARGEPPLKLLMPARLPAARRARSRPLDAAPPDRVA